RIHLTKIAEVESPTAFAVRPGDDALYVTEQEGRVRVIHNGRVDAKPAIDLTADVKSGGEQGLLGLAFSNDGKLAYLDYTDSNGDVRVVEVDLGSGSRRQVLFVRHPFTNHNGGQLVMRPDGTLWIGVGDGGSEGDPNGMG